MNERQVKDDERIVAAARCHLDPLTGRLRPEECGTLFQQLAAGFDVCWAAVALAIPVALRPTKEDWTAYKRRRGAVPRPCPGCGWEECPDCRRSAEQLGRFTRAELDEATKMAGILGTLTFADLDREKRRRESRGLR